MLAVTIARERLVYASISFHSRLSATTIGMRHSRGARGRSEVITARIRSSEIDIHLVLSCRSTWLLVSYSYCGRFYSSRRVLQQGHVPTLDLYRYRSPMSTFRTDIPCEAYHCPSEILLKTYRFYHTSKQYQSDHGEAKLTRMDCQFLEQHLGLQHKLAILYRRHHEKSMSNYARRYL
jgi:hypothetical protein